MIQKGSRIRHKEEETYKKKGIMTVLEVKNGFALCVYVDFERYGQGAENYPISELKLAE